MTINIMLSASLKNNKKPTDVSSLYIKREREEGGRIVLHIRKTYDTLLLFSAISVFISSSGSLGVY